MDCIKAKLKTTSESWIASIILALNLIKLMGKALYWLRYPNRLHHLLAWLRTSAHKHIIINYNMKKLRVGELLSKP
jgi:hypothetical protein